MANESINIGELITLGEPPLPNTIQETYVEFETPDGAVIKGVYCQPKNIPITQKALFLHEIEGRYDGGAQEVIARRYADIGIASLRIDFSGHGSRLNEWERYSPESMFRDATQSIDWLDEKLPEIQKTIACGFSTGGGIAIMLRSTDSRISKVCGLYPVLSFKHNFIAATYEDSELPLPLNEWDKYTLWRKHEFTKEKLRASLKHGHPFSLTAHTYGAGFIKGCKKLADDGDDIDMGLHNPLPKNVAPLTVIQGTNDFAVPYELAYAIHNAALKHTTPFRLVTMEGMNHWVPPKWKKSVLYQFLKAAIDTPEQFNPRHTVVSLRPQQKGLTWLEAPLQ